MKKSASHSTTDEWASEADDLSPLKKVTLAVTGNGTKTGNCILHFSRAEGGPGALVVLTTLAEAQALVSQLSIVATQWEERLGNSQRA